jgi:hypothetical protein
MLPTHRCTDLSLSPSVIHPANSDMSLTPDGGGAAGVTVSIPPSDPARMGSIHLTRSRVAPGSVPHQQTTFTTAFLDLSQVYGSGMRRHPSIFSSFVAPSSHLISWSQMPRGLMRYARRAVGGCALPPSIQKNSSRSVCAPGTQLFSPLPSKSVGTHFLLYSIISVLVRRSPTHSRRISQTSELPPVRTNHQILPLL